MTRLIAALWACIAAVEASAADHLVLHGLSWHSGTRVETRTEQVAPTCTTKKYGQDACAWGTRTVEVTVPYNETNWGAGWRRTYGSAWATQVGAYLNSYDKWSAYALGEWTPLQAGQVSAGLFAGVASGYDHGFTAGGLVARWQGDRLGVAVRFMPDVSEKVRGSVTTVEASWRVGG